MTKPTVIDLFCGCGGFSLGANLAGFENLLSVDIDPILTSSYKLNFPKSKLLLRDLSKSLDLTREIPKGNVDAVIGGPPCQGFSMSGKRNADDPRNMLISHFFLHVMKIRPKFFIMENVEGIIAGYGKAVLDSALKNAAKHYEIYGPIKIKASDFGAATTRPRVVVIGYDKRYVNKVGPEDIEKLSATATTVREAISDLPSPYSAGVDGELGCARYQAPLSKVSEYAKRMRKAPKGDLGWKDAVEWLKEEKVSGTQNTEHSLEIVRRFKKLPQGGRDPVSRYIRLNWEKPSHTLRAGTGADKGSHQAPRPIHPVEPRVITVREGARLQGFPDWFVFHPAKWHSFRMIGNSVSPVLAEKLMRMMAAKLKKRA